MMTEGVVSVGCTNFSSSSSAVAREGEQGGETAFDADRGLLVVVPELNSVDTRQVVSVCLMMVGGSCIISEEGEKAEERREVRCRLEEWFIKGPTSSQSRTKELGDIGIL